MRGSTWKPSRMHSAHGGRSKMLYLTAPTRRDRASVALRAAHVSHNQEGLLTLFSPSLRAAVGGGRALCTRCAPFWPGRFAGVTLQWRRGS